MRGPPNHLNPAVLSILLLSNCAHIQSYSTVSVIPDNDNIFVLTPPPTNLSIYDPSLAEQWVRTYNHCIQVKNAVAKEIDQREYRLTVRRGWIMTLGGLAGLINSLYTALEDHPEKGVTVPLGMFSGTALLSFLPVIAGDERLQILRQKLERLNATQSQAEGGLRDVDSALLEKAFLDQDYEKDNSKEKKELIDQEIEETTRLIDTLSNILKTTLTKWSIEAQ